MLGALLVSFDKQNIAMIYYIGSYYLFGIPLAIFFGFYLDYRIPGLWLNKKFILKKKKINTLY